MQNKSEESLRDLGFPEDVIQESIQAERLGLFKIKPSEHLVKRTVARCRNLLRTPPSAETNVAESELFDVAIEAFAGRVFALQKAETELARVLKALPIEAEERTEFERLERLPIDCLATATFVQKKRLRPLMMVDNHNVINPSWWESDSGFRAFRLACRVVNTIAQKNDVPPAAVLMVLRPDMSSYDKDDFAAIGKLLQSATSDVWMISYDKAGQYQDRDVIVFGQERVLSLRGGFDSPGDAFSAFRELSSIPAATAERENIEQATREALELKAVASEIRRWEDAQTLVESVIEGRHLRREWTGGGGVLLSRMAADKLRDGF